MRLCQTALFQNETPNLKIKIVFFQQALHRITMQAWTTYHLQYCAVVIKFYAILTFQYKKSIALFEFFY